MRNKQRNVFTFQLLTDHMIAILILSTVLALAIKIYLPYRQKARLTHVIGGSPFLEMRAQMMLYRALHGEWPRNNQQVLSLGWWGKFDGFSEYKSTYIEEANIDNGAIHFTLSKDFEGQIVTVRPAVPASDPLGPVIWICGNREPATGWVVYGDDRTTVDAKYIHSSWR
jgi:type IV pilus assembly protein PilA